MCAGSCARFPDCFLAVGAGSQVYLCLRLLLPDTKGPHRVPQSARVWSWAVGQGLDGEGLQERPWEELEPPPTRLEALPHAGGSLNGWLLLGPCSSCSEML